MHIVHIIDTLGIGGTSTFLLTLLTEWHTTHPTDRHTVIFFKDNAYVARLQNIGVQTLHLPHWLPRYFLDLIPRLMYQFWRLTPDIIHTILPNSVTYGLLAGLAMRIPVINGVHLNVHHSYRHHKSGRLHHLIACWFSQYAAHHVAVSSLTRRQFLQQLFRGRERVKCSVIVNGSPSIMRHSNKRAKPPFIFGAVGRLSPEKRFDLLLNAVAKLKNKHWHLYIVGDGPERAALETQVQSLGLNDQVTLTGHQDNMADWYDRFDCLIISSDTEALSYALLEAMAAGCAIISTHAGTTHDALTHEYNGLLTPINNRTALTAALKKIMVDDNLRNKMGKRNKKLVATKFSAHTMMMAYQKLFTTLMQ